MPDHVHLVVQTTDVAGDVARFSRLAKQYAGYAHSQQVEGACGNPAGTTACFARATISSPSFATSCRIPFEPAWYVTRENIRSSDPV